MVQPSTHANTRALTPYPAPHEASDGIGADPGYSKDP